MTRFAVYLLLQVPSTPVLSLLPTIRSDGYRHMSAETIHLSRKSLQRLDSWPRLFLLLRPSGMEDISCENKPLIVWHVREAVRYIISSLRLTSPSWPPQSTIQLNGHIVAHTFILTFVSYEEIFMCPLEQSVEIPSRVRLTDLVDIWSGLTRGSGAARLLRGHSRWGNIQHPGRAVNCCCSTSFVLSFLRWHQRGELTDWEPTPTEGPFILQVRTIILLYWQRPCGSCGEEGRYCCLFSSCLYFSKH